MRQIWITKLGRPETLVVKEAPDPEPRAGEVRIRVEASGVDFRRHSRTHGGVNVFPVRLPVSCCHRRFPIAFTPAPDTPGDALGAKIDECVLGWPPAEDDDLMA